MSEGQPADVVINTLFFLTKTLPKLTPFCFFFQASNPPMEMLDSHMLSFEIQHSLSPMIQQQPPHEALPTIRSFLLQMFSMVRQANENTRGFLLLGINGVVFHQLTSVTSYVFDEKRKLLNFGEAFNMSLPPMVHISMIVWSFALNYLLLFRLNPGIQCILLLVTILMQWYYFAELARGAAGIAVDLGSFKMPLLWFSFFGGIGMALFSGSTVLLIVFLSWLCARRRGLEFQGIRVNGDSIIGAMNA
ncbi:uncharacterized protein LOC130974399 isoform X2 [Arachis stenosperma]|uniref:uncharacterized protein LOC130974399 isoform X2 n=1 Tax=Arachis stenosperma TaxID=217475 RepID=UPI0025AD6708|nr:uncharacterized protein LOC130974399 isoform X2 [Arachis stenosperma]